MWLWIAAWVAGAALIGWPLVRLGLPGERRASALLAAALCGGYALQSIVLILLWGFAGLPLALVLTLALAYLLAATVVATRHHLFDLSGLAWGIGRNDALMTVALVAAFAFLAHRLFTVGYTAWDPEALYWHSGIASSIAFSGYPPTSPVEPDDPIRYRIGLYFPASAIMAMTNDSPPAVLAACLAVAMPVLVVALAGASVRLFGTPRPGLVAASLGLFGGSLLSIVRMVQAAAGSPGGSPSREYVSGMLWLGNNLDMLRNNITISGGFAFFCAALWLGWEGLLRGNQRAPATVLAWAALAYLGLVNEVHFATLAAGLGAAAVLSAARSEQRGLNRWSASLRVAGAVAGSLLLVLLRGGILGGASLTDRGPGSVELVLNTQHFGQVPTPPGIWEPVFVPFLSLEAQIDSDLVVLGLPLLLYAALRIRNHFAMAGLLAGAAALALWLTVYPQRAPYDGFRFGQAGLSIYLTMAPFVVASLRERTGIPTRSLVRWGQPAALAALTMPHLALALWAAVSPPSPWISVPGSPDYEAAEWLRGTRTTGRVLVPLATPQGDFMDLYRGDTYGAALRTIVGDSGHAVPIGHGQYDNSQAYLDRYRAASAGFDRATLDSLKVDWVYILPRLLTPGQRAALETARSLGELELAKAFGVLGTDSERWLFSRPD